MSFVEGIDASFRAVLRIFFHCMESSLPNNMSWFMCKLSMGIRLCASLFNLSVNDQQLM
jgi:hypothetical protein